MSWEGTMTKWLYRYFEESLTRLLVQEEAHTPKSDTISPIEETHPSDEPDQGTKGTQGPDSRDNGKKINVLLKQEAKDSTTHRI